MDPLIPGAQSLFSLQTFQVRMGQTLEVCSDLVNFLVAQTKSSCTIQNIQIYCFIILIFTITS